MTPTQVETSEPASGTPIIDEFERIYGYEKMHYLYEEARKLETALALRTASLDKAEDELAEARAELALNKRSLSCCVRDVLEGEDKLAAAQRDLAEARKNEARYRHLRKRATAANSSETKFVWRVAGSIPAPNNEHFDAAVDAEIAKFAARASGEEG